MNCGKETEAPARVRTAEAGSGNLLVLGLGNDILSDDAVGLLVARRLAQELSDFPFIEVKETTEMGLALLDFLEGYSGAILVDSIQTPRTVPGDVLTLKPEELNGAVGQTPHFLGVPETLALGRQLDVPMPSWVRIVAVRVEDPFTLGTRLTSAVAAAVPVAVRRIKRLAFQFAKSAR